MSGKFVTLKDKAKKRKKKQQRLWFKNKQDWFYDATKCGTNEQTKIYQRALK